MARHWRSVLIFLVLFSEKSFCYPTPVDFSGKVSRWDIDINSPEVSYAIEAEDSSMQINFETISEESAALWSNVSGSYLRLKKADENTTPHITIHFDNTIEGGESSAGYAEFDESSDQGPTHCAIHIAVGDYLDWENLSKTTLHEMGHCVGLGHSLVPQSIMSYQLDKNSFALALDDEAVVSRLYPKNASQSKLPAGCSLGGFRANHSPIFLLLILFFPLFSMRFPLSRK